MESMGDIFAYSGRFFSVSEIRFLSCFSWFYAEFLSICFPFHFLYTVYNKRGAAPGLEVPVRSGKTRYGKGEGTMKKAGAALLLAFVRCIAVFSALGDNAQINNVPESIAMNSKAGDPADPLIWACMGALGLAALFLMWRLLKESRDDR